MVEFQGLDQVKFMDEVVKAIVYFNQILDQKKDDLRDSLELIRDFYENTDVVDQEDFDLEGKGIKIKVYKPMARNEQKNFDDALVEIATQVSSVFVVSNTLKKEMHQLGTERISAATKSEQVQGKEEGAIDKIRNVFVGNQPKKQKEYASLNELDDPFKLSKNQIQEIENYSNIFDKWVELHNYSIEIAEETTLAGQKRVLDIETNFFKSRVQNKLLRMIDEADRIQRVAEQSMAKDVAIAAKQEANRQRNAMGMMPPNTQQ